MKKSAKTVAEINAEINAELDAKTVAAQVKSAPAKKSGKKELPAPAMIIIDVPVVEVVEQPIAPVIDPDDDKDFPEPPVSPIKPSLEGKGTPAVLPTTAPAVPMVFCGLCERSVPKNTTFTLPSSDGEKFYCKKDTACRKPTGKKVDLKTQAQVATAKADAKKEKPAKVAKGPNPNIGKFDDCALSGLENKRHGAESTRTKIYNYISENPMTTIKDMVEANVNTLPIVRDCVKKLFADLKISIQGWEVVTPRTLNFRQVQSKMDLSSSRMVKK